MKQRKDEEERMGDDWVRGGVGGVGWGETDRGILVVREEEKKRRSGREGKGEANGRKARAWQAVAWQSWPHGVTCFCYRYRQAIYVAALVFNWTINLFLRIDIQHVEYTRTHIKIVCSLTSRKQSSIFSSFSNRTLALQPSISKS